MRLPSSAGAALAALLLTSCGQVIHEENPGGSLTDPTGATVLLVETVPLVAASDVQRPDIIQRDVVVPAAGLVRAEVDWMSADHDVDIIVTHAECRSGIAAWNGDCEIYREDRTTLTKPARVDFTLAAGATVRVFVYNFSAFEEVATVQVLHRPTS